MFLVTMVDWFCVCQFGLPWFFFKISFSLCIFVGNMTWVILRPCQCISSGGTRCQFVSLLVMFPKSVTAGRQGCIGQGMWEGAWRIQVLHECTTLPNLQLGYTPTGKLSKLCHFSFFIEGLLHRHVWLNRWPLVIELKLQLLPFLEGGAKLQPSNQTWFPWQ